MSPCTEDLISIVRISSEANTIASMEKCFSIIDKEIEELNRESQKLQEEYLKQIVAISNRLDIHPDLKVWDSSGCETLRTPSR